MAREERRAKEQSASSTPQARRNQQHSQASDQRKVVKKPGAPSKLPRLRAAAVGRAIIPEIERYDRGRGDRDTLPAREKEAPEPRWSFRVPLTWVKNFIGIFLLPVAWVWTVSFVGAFRHATVHQAYWRTEDFWFFVLGAVLWLVTFSGSLYAKGEPWLLRWYVWVHEWTHAIWTWLSNGRVSELKVYRDHGHILTNKPTVLVTLAPYFYPLPCVVLMTLFLVVRPFYVIEDAPPVLWGLLLPIQILLLLMGVCWSFHCTFTVWMIRRGQSDLKMHGNLFSLVLIYIVNIALMSLFLILTAPGVEFGTFANELFFNAKDFSDVVWALWTKLR
jgi:hypothetical protein